jgi:hypothetical protein
VKSLSLFYILFNETKGAKMEEQIRLLVYVRSTGQQVSEQTFNTWQEAMDYAVFLNNKYEVRVL